MLHTMLGESVSLDVTPEVGGKASNLAANFSYTSFVLSWDKSEDPDLEKYLILYKMDPSSGSYNGAGLTYAGDPGNEDSPISVPITSLSNPDVPAIELGGMLMDTPYWFAIIAVNSNQNESAMITLDGNITPTEAALATMSFYAPRGVIVKYNSSDNSIMFTWQTVE